MRQLKNVCLMHVFLSSDNTTALIGANKKQNVKMNEETTSVQLLNLRVVYIKNTNFLKKMSLLPAEDLFSNSENFKWIIQLRIEVFCK